MRGLMVAGLMTASAWAGFGAVEARAQAIEGRVDKLEREMRAVQRKLFPGGSGLTLEPQITAPATAPVVPGTPAGSALTDITQRLASLESQMTGLVGQTEQNGFKLRQLEEAFNAYRAATDRRLATLEGAATVTPASVAAAGNTADDDSVPPPAARPAPARQAAPRAGPAPAASRPATTAAPASARATPERIAAVAAVERPATGDDAEDTYSYGYRLWNAKFYPEAQAQLKLAAEKFPRHRRASYAQNLLGRAYLDEGKPALASVAFYDSYKKWPEGERAAESLMYLGQSLTRLKKPADACKVYDELAEVYAGKMAASVRSGMEKGRADAKCAAAGA